MMTLPLTLLGLNHTTAPVTLRERLYFGRQDLAAFAAELLALPGIAECAVLSTCNRTEVVLAGENREEVEKLLAARAGIPIAELCPHLYGFTDRAVIVHLFRVACGLDSLILGETQILKQMRDALEAARSQGAAGRLLIGLFEQALATGKRARTETAISDGAFSIGHAGVAMARRLFPDLSASPVLMLGAGKMSELTARHLATNGARTIFVANRTYHTAEVLARQLGGQAIHYNALLDVLAHVDILISSTSAPHWYCTPSRLQA